MLRTPHPRDNRRMIAPLRRCGLEDRSTDPRARERSGVSSPRRRNAPNDQPFSPIACATYGWPSVHVIGELYMSRLTNAAAAACLAFAIAACGGELSLIHISEPTRLL